MNIHQCRIVLRPRGPLESFDLAIELLRTHPGVFVRLALLVGVAPFVLLSAGALLTDGHWAWLVVAVVAAPLLQAPFTLLGGRLLFADTWTVWQVLVEVVQRPAALFSAVFWPIALIGVSATCVGISLPLVLPAAAFAAEAALLERSDFTDTIGRSIRLALYAPFGAFAAATVWVAATLWAIAVGEAGGQLLFGWVLELGTPFGGLLDGVVTPFALFGAIAVQPLLALHRLLLFVDARTRIDGWDLQVGMRAARLASAPRLQLGG